MSYMYMPFSKYLSYLADCTLVPIYKYVQDTYAVNSNLTNGLRYCLLEKFVDLDIGYLSILWSQDLGFNLHILTYFSSCSESTTASTLVAQRWQSLNHLPGAAVDILLDAGLNFLVFMRLKFKELVHLWFENEILGRQNIMFSVSELCLVFSLQFEMFSFWCF